MNKDELQTCETRISLVDVMLELVRASVLNRVPRIAQDCEIDWDKLMDISVKQGLLALVWDGICKLPIELQPSRQYRINWGLSAQSYWDDYEESMDVLDYMIGVCRQNNMRLLLLKGLGLSSLYPKPQSRPAGDIDVFFFNDFQKGNKIFCGKRLFVISKHTTLNIKGITVENHRDFFEPETLQKRKILKYIHSTLDAVVLLPRGYYILPPLSNFIFLCFHTLKHFNDGFDIPVRNIIDFALFIINNESELPPLECHKLLEEFHLLESFEFLICLAEWVLGVEFVGYHFAVLPTNYIKEIQDILDCSIDDSSEDEKIYLKHKITHLIPKNSGITNRNFFLVFGVWLLRALFFIPQGASFKKTMKSRLQRTTKMI